MFCAVIQGASDVGKELTEDEVQKAMDFCTNIYAPVDPDQSKIVRERIDPQLLAKDGPILLPDDISNIVGPQDEEVVNLLKRYHARRPLRELFDTHGHFSHEELDGFVISCEGGRLGLAAVKDQK